MNVLLTHTCQSANQISILGADICRTPKCPTTKSPKRKLLPLMAIPMDKGHLPSEHGTVPYGLPKRATPGVWKLPELPGTTLRVGKRWGRAKEERGTIDTETQAIERNPHTQDPPDSRRVRTCEDGWSHPTELSDAIREQGL